MLMKYYGNNNSEWGLSTSAQFHTLYGDYHPIDYMYGDSLCLYLHCPKSSYISPIVYLVNLMINSANSNQRKTQRQPNC